MSSFVNDMRSLPIAAALTKSRLVKQTSPVSPTSSATWSHCGAGDIADGIMTQTSDTTMANATPAFVAAAELLRHGMTRTLVASEAITAGDDVYTAASGKITGYGTGPTGFKVGTAREAATADGDEIEVEIRPDYSVWYAKILGVSTSIAGTAADTAYDKSIAVPANLLRIGSRGRIRAKVNIPTTTGAETLLLKVKIFDGTNTVTLFASAAIDVADADVGVIDVSFELPTATTIVSDALGAVGVLTTGTARAGGVLSSTYAPTAAATITVTQTASITGETSALQSLSVEIRR